MTTRVGDERHGRLHALSGDQPSPVTWMAGLPTALPSTLRATTSFALASGQSVGGRRLRGRCRVLLPQRQLVFQVGNLLVLFRDLLRPLGQLPITFSNLALLPRARRARATRLSCGLPDPCDVAWAHDSYGRLRQKVQVQNVGSAQTCDTPPELLRPGARKRLGIVEGVFVEQRVGVDAREAFHEMHVSARPPEGRVDGEIRGVDD